MLTVRGKERTNDFQKMSLSDLTLLYALLCHSMSYLQIKTTSERPGHLLQQCAQYLLSEVIK